MAGGALPSGEVTFVFSDIEGSTRLLRELGDDYATLLQEHRRILREVWTRFDGHELGTEGDSFLVAFADPTDALMACRAGQYSLSRTKWVGGTTVRVRMGAHRGHAVPLGDEYVSMAIHQAARVAAAAHGAQVLLTREVVVDDRVAVTSLGQFRVRDFEGPTEILAVELDDPSALRQPRLVPATGHNIGAPRGELIARENELAALDPIVGPGSITTVTGPGGVGKSRLAAEYGRRTAHRWADGAWLVALEDIEDPALVPRAIADAVGLTIEAPSTEWNRVLAALETRSALLILDGCEHLFPDIVLRVADLATNCPNTALLLTSREPLGLVDERIHRLAPLATNTARHEPSPASLLFAARSARPLREADKQAVDDICSALDGLPLAIEIAAARTSAVPVGEILQAVRSSKTALVARDPRMPSRHRSLTRAFRWSYDLLSDAEQYLLRVLTVFRSSFDLAAAAAATGGSADETSDRLWQLVDKSLVATEENTDERRFRLLGVMRECASELLDPDERHAARQRLLGWYGQVLGPDNSTAVSWVWQVGREADNLRELFAEPRPGDDAQLQRLAWSVGRFHDLNADFEAGLRVLDEAIETLREPTPERAALLTLRADIHLRRNDISAATVSLAEAERITERAGVVRWDDSGAVRTRGEIWLRSGDLEEAIRTARAGLTNDDMSDRGQARLYDLLGIALSESGDFAGSIAAFEEELQRWERLGLASFVATTHSNLAEACLRAGSDVACAQHQLAALELGRALGRTAIEPFTVLIASQLAMRAGSAERALRLQAAAEAALSEIGYELYADDLKAKDELAHAASAHLRADQVTAAVQSGRRADPEHAAAEARLVLEEIIEGTSQ